MFLLPPAVGGRHDPIAFRMTTNGDPRVVFVTALTHSGSTLLDTLIGSQPGCVALGEVVPLLTDSSYKLFEADRRCSCGLPISDCSFWSAARDIVETVSDFAGRYQAALRAFQDIFGAQAVAVDSSKSLHSLRRIERLPVDLRIIHLTRDVRSWIVSRKDTDIRRGRYSVADIVRLNRWSALRPLLFRSSFARALLWYHANRSIEDFVQSSGRPALELDYEGLCKAPDSMNQRIARFIGLESFTVAAPQAHVALGNYARFALSSGAEIRYDDRWQTRSEWRLPALLFPHIMRYNHEHIFPYAQTDKRVELAALAWK